MAMQYQPTISYQGKVESGDIESSFGATNDAKKILMTSHSTTNQKQVAVAAAAKRREIVEMRCDMLEHRHREDKQHHFWERGTKMNLVQQNFTDSIVL